jgi:hypothetical protein
MVMPGLILPRAVATRRAISPPSIFRFFSARVNPSMGLSGFRHLFEVPVSGV